MMAVTRLCQRVIWIHDGKVIADGEPDDVIGQYEESSWTLLGGEEQGEGVVTENEHARLARVRLVSDLGEEVGAVTVADDFGIELTLEIREPGISVRCAVAFLAEGASAFRSVQPEPLEADPGTYVATVKAPKHLLADITYSVKVGGLPQRRQGRHGHAGAQQRRRRPGLRHRRGGVRPGLVCRGHAGAGAAEAGLGRRRRYPEPLSPGGGGDEPKAEVESSPRLRRASRSEKYARQTRKQVAEASSQTASLIRTVQQDLADGLRASFGAESGSAFGKMDYPGAEI